MTARKTRIADLLGPPGPFYRSISIDRDFNDEAALRGYLVTPWPQRVAFELSAGPLPGSRRRASPFPRAFAAWLSATARATVLALRPAFLDPRIR